MFKQSSEDIKQNTDKPIENDQRSCNALDKLIGENLAIHRRSRGLSQSDLGKPLGISYQQIQKYERGLNRISASRLFLCAKLLNVNFLDMFPHSNSAFDLMSLLDGTPLPLLKNTRKIGKPNIRHALEDLAEAISNQYPL